MAKSTKGLQMTPADVCRERGWLPGTLLIGDEGYGPTIIKITAIGTEAILAVQVSHNGKRTYDREGTWMLSCRDWEEVSQ